MGCSGSKESKPDDKAAEGANDEFTAGPNASEAEKDWMSTLGRARTQSVSTSKAINPKPVPEEWSESLNRVRASSVSASQAAAEARKALEAMDAVEKSEAAGKGADVKKEKSEAAGKGADVKKEEAEEAAGGGMERRKSSKRKKKKPVEKREEETEKNESAAKEGAANDSAKDDTVKSGEAEEKGGAPAVKSEAEADVSPEVPADGAPVWTSNPAALSNPRKEEDPDKELDWGDIDENLNFDAIKPKVIATPAVEVTVVSEEAGEAKTDTVPGMGDKRKSSRRKKKSRATTPREK